MKHLKYAATLLALGLALGAAWVAVTPGHARADQNGTMTCGGSVSGFGLVYWNYPTVQDPFWQTGPGTFSCGDGKTFQWEIQSTSDKGFHWTDYGPEHTYTSPAGCNGGCGHTFYGPLDAACGHGLQIDGYRVHFWLNGSDYKWPADGNRIGDGDMCNGPPNSVIQQGQ